MNRIGVDLFPYYLAVRMADAKAQSLTEGGKRLRI